MKQSQKKKWINIISVLLLCASASAVPIDLNKTSNKVQFLAVGTPSAIKIRGNVSESKALTGAVTTDATSFAGNAIVKLDALDTGISLRDKHMKEKYLETAKFPTAKLTIAPTTVGDSTKEGFSFKGPFTGTLALHGAEKPVTGTLELKRSSGKLEGSFAFSLELQNFGIEIPSYLGIKVSKSVDVEASFKE